MKQFLQKELSKIRCFGSFLFFTTYSSPSFIQGKLDYGAEENFNLIRVNDGLGTIVMIVDYDSSRILDILRYSNVFRCELTRKGMRKMVNDIRKLLNETNCHLEENENLGFTICIARGNRGYVVYGNGIVFDLKDFDCDAYVEERVRTIYEQCKQIKDISERITTVYKQLEKEHVLQYFPVAFIFTKDNEYQVITQ